MTATPSNDLALDFERLYRTYRDQVFGTCLRLSGDRVRASEWMQDVFVRIWEQFATRDDRDNAAAWVHRVTLHTIYNVTRGERRRLARVALADDGPALPEAATATTSPFSTPAPVRRMALERAIDSLAGRARDVFVLHDVERHSTDDIAALLRMAPSPVRVHLARARARLREELTA